MNQNKYSANTDCIDQWACHGFYFPACRMLNLNDTIIIKSTPDRIWDTLIFFFQSTDNYTLWHKDHISCYRKKGKDFSKGSILIAEELIHGKKHKLGFRIQKIYKDELMEYTMLFPFSVICSGGSYKLVAKGSETEFSAQLNFRLGSLLKIFFRKQIAELKKHMKEEGQNLKEFIEKTHNHSGTAHNTV